MAAPVARSVERPRGDGMDTLISGTLQAGGKAAGSATQQDAEAGMLIPIAAYPIQNATRGKDQNGLGIGDAGAPMYTLDNGSQHGVALAPIAFDSRQDCVSSTDVFGALGSSSPQAQAVAFSCKDHGADATVELAPTMRAMGHQGSHANAGGQLAVCITGDITHTLKAEGFDASEDGTGRGQPIVAAMAFCQNTRDEVRLMGGDGEISGALAAQPGMKQTTYVAPGGMAVRRLTPRECERLQAFPDFYTLIPISIVKASRAEDMLAKGDPVACVDGVWWKLAADGPRYKALGNSMCTYNIAWIGRRIELALMTAEQMEAA